MLLHERQVEDIIEGVVARLTREIGVGTTVQGKTPPAFSGVYGVFPSLEEAVKAAKRSAQEVALLPLEKRRKIIRSLRQAALDNLELISRMAVEETGMGRVEDKIKKNRLAAEKTPGVEILVPQAVSGDDGLTLTELAPYGLIGSIIPSTNPTETVINNGIGMFAAGNSVLFNPHPGAKRTSLFMIDLFSRVVEENGGPPHVFVTVSEPSIDTATAIMSHPDVKLLVVTGAEGVVKAAMKSGKKVIGAGPGNPPAVVDETADLAKAARDIVSGASLDNNIICVDEKVTVAVAKIADELVREMEKAGAYRASDNQVRQLERILFAGDPKPRMHNPVERKFVGKDARVILEAIGVRGEGDPRLVVCEVSNDHPIAWSEMLMPVMPVVRVRDVDEAIAYAVAVEDGRRHTASMHSKNIEKLSKMAHDMNCSIFVKNGPNYAGLGFGGEGYTSFTIASPTGEGVTTALDFCRSRRCTLVGSFRIV